MCANATVPEECIKHHTSSTSALPHKLLTERLPCLATRAPAAAAMTVAPVEMLTDPMPSPPVPTMSNTAFVEVHVENECVHENAFAKAVVQVGCTIWDVSHQPSHPTPNTNTLPGTPSYGVLTRNALECMALARPAISAAVSPLALKSTRKDAMLAGQSLSSNVCDGGIDRAHNRAGYSRVYDNACRLHYPHTSSVYCACSSVRSWRSSSASNTYCKQLQAAVAHVSHTAPHTAPHTSLVVKDAVACPGFTHCRAVKSRVRCLDCVDKRIPRCWWALAP